MANILGKQWWNLAKKPYDRYPGIGSNNLYTTPSGRKLYRHSNDEGSCLCYYRFGVYAVLFIPDCKYRSATYWCNYRCSMLGFGTDGVSTYYVNDDESSSTGDIILTDKALESHSLLSSYVNYPNGFWQCRCNSSYENALSSQGVTQNLINLKNTTVGDIPEMGAPDVYEGVLLRIEGKYIDSLDKYRTDSTYKVYCFSPDYSGNSLWFGASSGNEYLWTVTLQWENGQSMPNQLSMGQTAITPRPVVNTGLLAPVRELRYGEWKYY